METTTPSTAIQTAEPKPAGTPPAGVPDVALGESPDPRRKPKPGWLRAIEALASLRLTVVLFVLSGILVFWGTWAQRDAGIWDVMRDYFRGFIAWIPVKVLTFFSLPAAWSVNQVTIPFPGGWTLGFLLLFNLLAAHAVRFKFSWKRSGILILHAGIIIMMLGEFFTGLSARERMMVIFEGETVGHLQDNRSMELAIVTPAQGGGPDDEHKKDEIFAVYRPGIEKAIEKKSVIADPSLPFQVKILEFHENSDFGEVDPGHPKAAATRGYGATLVFKPEPVIAGANPDQKHEDPYVVVELLDKGGASLGTYAMSFNTGYFFGAEKIKIGGKTYEMSFRPKREYLDGMTVTLVKAIEKKHPNMDMAKDYRSVVLLKDPANKVDRELEIWMNNPLRHNGWTFFQANMGSRFGVPFTGLQVVRNWAWTWPYIACAVVALGMLIHFGGTLINFIDKQSKATKGLA